MNMARAYLEKLTLTGFRNYETAVFDFVQGINLLWGSNGAGKTNVLDAIHYLCLTKSFLNQSDQQNIRFGDPAFIIRGIFSEKDMPVSVVCSVQRDEKKIFRVQEEIYRKISAHIGRFPLVAILPGDYAIISEGSDRRRKFTDGVIAQYNPEFLDSLLQYQAVLEQRNKYLKQVRENPSLTLSLMDVYNQQLDALGSFIHARRKAFLEMFAGYFSDCYRSISGQDDEVHIKLLAGFEGNSPLEEMERALKKDIANGFTSSGAHRDDLEFTLNTLPLKRYASQGQQKSFLIALRLASHSLLHKSLGTPPALLIDDFSDKLDAGRSQRLTELLTARDFGQVFITDTAEIAGLKGSATGGAQVQSIRIG